MISTRILLSARSAKELTEHQKKLMARGLPRKKPLQGVSNVVMVASGKGGVGKSTTAINLALALSSRRSVGVLDADIYGPSVPTMLGVKGNQPDVSPQGKMIPPVKFGLKVMSIGLLLNKSEGAVVWRGPMVINAIEKMTHGTAWDPLDILVVDLPPGTGDIHLSLAQTLEICGAVVVSTPQKVALADAKRSVDMFEKVNVPVLGIVQNMSSFVCAKCGEITHVFGTQGARDLSEARKVPLLADIPLDPVIMQTVDVGQPLAAVAPDSLAVKEYDKLAESVEKYLSFS